MERRGIRTTFYISEFEEEEKWLECMQKQGWKFVKTDNKSYEFEKCPKEDWIYRLDFKANGLEEKDYLQMFEDCGWEFIQHWKHWFYFRKKKTAENEDYSIFSDRESKIAMCERVLKGRLFRKILLPTLLLTAIYCCFILLSDQILRGSPLNSILSEAEPFCFGICVMYVIYHHLSQYKKVKMKIKKMKNPLD